MTNRIDAFKKHIQDLGDAGVRKTTFYPLLGESLAQTPGEPRAVRRAKAFVYLMDHVNQVVLPHELVAGSILGMWPLDEKPLSYEELLASADEAVQKYIDVKTGKDTTEETRIAVGFKKGTSAGQARWALMARDHYDTNATFADMQSIIHTLEDKYKDEPAVEKFEIGRVIERRLEYTYDEATMRLLADLPWEAANHLDLNYGKVVQLGFGGILEEIDTFASKAGPEKAEFYATTRMTVEAAIRFIERYADTLTKESQTEEARRALELLEMAEICRKIASGKPESFREALQLVWMTHLIGNLGGGSAMSFARFDQYLRTSYETDIANRTLTHAQANELLACMFLKVNEPKQRTVQSMCIGGVQPDGIEGTSDLTKCCIETCRYLKLPYPNMAVRYHDELSPEWLLDEAVKTIQVGFGMPMILNDRVWVDNLTSIGYKPEDAREYYNMGCVETLIQGKQSNWIGSGGINFIHLLLEVLEETKAGKHSFSDFESFLDYYVEREVAALDDTHLNGARQYERIQEKNCDPFASALIEGCVEKGLDLFQGGAALGPHFAMGGSSLGTAVDSLSAIKTFVFEQKRFSLDQLIDMMKNNFAGQESIRTLLEQQTPSYGNDIDDVDDIAKTIFDTYIQRVHSYNDGSFAVDPETGELNPRFVSVLFSYNSHLAMGETTGATPNGRIKGKYLSECIGPSQGHDVNGPTKMMNSVLKLDLEKITGALAFNVKINPSWAQKPAGKAILTALIRAWLKDNGPQMQFNMQHVADLKEAQAHPEEHRDIVVRIAGYCEFFVNLDLQLQNEIISRTEHELA